MRATVSCLFLVLIFGVLLRAQASIKFIRDGAASHEQFGLSVSAAGDVNADGYDDVIVGAFGSDINGANAGSAIVYSGFDGSVLYTFYGDNAGDWLGISVSGAGDVNLDGFADLVAGAPRDDNNGLSSGSARVFSGFDGTILYTFYGDGPLDSFGESVSGAGDVNGDGYADIIVGAPGDNNNGADSGSARIFSGLDGSILFTRNGESINDQFGYPVACAGDVNCDGYDDVVVGAKYDDTNGIDSGSAWVLSGFDGASLHVFFGDSAGDEFGFSVAGAGDVNADGFHDIVVGAFGDDDNGAQSGSARVFSGIDGSILYTLRGTDALDKFGQAVDSAGDFNGDGYADIVIGAPGDDDGGMNSGSVQVVSGADGAILETLFGGSADDEFGASVGAAGDVDGDGFCDIVIGAHLDDNNGMDSGSATVFTAETLPVLKFRTESSGLHGIDLNWIPDGGDPLAVIGTLSCSGATSGGSGLYGASLARIDYLAFGYLPLLIGIDPVNSLSTGDFGFDVFGVLTAYSISRQIPALAGSSMYLQFFESNPVVASSPGLRLLIEP